MNVKIKARVTKKMILRSSCYVLLCSLFLPGEPGNFAREDVFYIKSAVSIVMSDYTAMHRTAVRFDNIISEPASHDICLDRILWVIHSSCDGCYLSMFILGYNAATWEITEKHVINFFSFDIGLTP